MAEPMQGGLTLEPAVAVEATEYAPGQVRSIAYWTSQAGQDELEIAGGWADSMALSSWLAQMHPELYGFDAGVNNLWGQKNRVVAAFAQVTEMMYGTDSEQARNLAAAFDEFTRACTLGQ